MLLSMTGHGEGRFALDGQRATVELRTVNNRYFKFALRGNSECLGALEAKVEAVVREVVRRGTVTVALKIERHASADQYQINGAVLRGYLGQLDEILADRRECLPVSAAALLALPGVAEEVSASAGQQDLEWRLCEPALREGLESLQAMRRAEGLAMQEELAGNLQDILLQLTEIESRAPTVVANYRDRLTERITQLLAEHEVSLSSADLVREVGIFADRCDISEEVVRLRSHLDQFQAVMLSDTSVGRKLDFLIQEMFRETNTIGSKANDAEIARHVVEIKTNVERMRELVQNVE